MSGNLGMGACPMGSTPFGFGSPATAPVATRAVLVQDDGTPGECARISTTTGDYVLDGAGNKVGWSGLEQRVYLALRTELGSSAVPSLGIELPSGVIRDDAPARIRNAVAAALGDLIGANLVALVEVLVSRPGPSALGVEVRWRALSTGQVRSTFI
jgi:hypothetical protein